MSLTLAQIITSDMSSHGGPAAGNLIDVATESGNAFTALTGGHSIASGPPVSLVAGNGSNPAMRDLAWRLERYWKYQQINGVSARFIEKQLHEGPGLTKYSSGQLLKNLTAIYQVKIVCQTDDINDLMISSANDQT